MAQISNLWYMATQAFDKLTLDGDGWLYDHHIPSFIGFESAMNVIVSYVATFMVVFVVVGSLLFMIGHYFHDEIATS
jgi:hypothetical protein